MTETQYKLSKIMQEAGELIQEASKAQLFGLDDVNPKTGETNQEAIKREFYDLLFAIYLLRIEGLEWVEDAFDNYEALIHRAIKHDQWVEYSKERGMTR